MCTRAELGRACETAKCMLANGSCCANIIFVDSLAMLWYYNHRLIVGANGHWQIPSRQKKEW